MLEKFISYDGLPLKSGGAHSISNADNHGIYLAVCDFFKCLTTDPSSVNRIILDVSVKQKGTTVSFWYMVMNFGLPDWSSTGSINGGFVWIFDVSEQQIAKAIGLSKQFANLTLTMMWRFQFVNVKTKTTIKGQNNIPILDERRPSSQVYLRLSRKTTMSLWFTLPFDELDTDAIAYIKLLKAKLPVKLSNNHWKILTLSKNGNWIGRKLDASITDE
jgi:hypothetical protein